MNTFSIKEALKIGWELFQKYWMVLIAVMVISIVAENLPVWILGKGNMGIGRLLSFLVTAFFTAGMVRVLLDAIEGKALTINTLFSQGAYYFNMLGALFLYTIAVMVGFILLIVPGIYLSTRLLFVPFLVIDKNLNPVDALKESWKMTEHDFFHFFKLWLVFIGLAILGAILLLVGLLVTIPIAALAVAFVYRKLSSTMAMPLATPADAPAQ